MKRSDIRTMRDVDQWLNEHPQRYKSGPRKGQMREMSRYDGLCLLFGADRADTIMARLMVADRGFCPDPKRVNMAREALR